MNTIAINLKNLRTAKGLSQNELAIGANIDIRTLQRIEGGETDPRGYTIRQLARVLGVTTDEILSSGKEKSIELYLRKIGVSNEFKVTITFINFFLFLFYLARIKFDDLTSPRNTISYIFMFVMLISTFIVWYVGRQKVPEH